MPAPQAEAFKIGLFHRKIGCFVVLGLCAVPEGLAMMSLLEPLENLFLVLYGLGWGGGGGALMDASPVGFQS